VATNADSPAPAGRTAQAAVGRTAQQDVPTIPYVERFGPEGEHEPVPGYVLLGEIARGGMGIVYRARQIGLNRVVALKMIRRHQDVEPHELRRFRIETEAIARLNHPHIVRIHDFGEHNGRPYFSMELIEGSGLASCLAEGPLTFAEAAHLIELLARAMDSAHRQQIIHRDLKPANVLLTTDGTPKIADFGLAKCLDDLKLTVPHRHGHCQLHGP
jgi:serine/threonine protein kinase